MTQERFLKLLDNPDLLTSISYEELKTLALAYPYAHNLRYLLALKARENDHPESARTLATAAAYSLDRSQLFRLLAPKHFAIKRLSKEEVLELRPIQALQRELQALTPLPRFEKQEEKTIVAAVITPTAAADKPLAPPEEEAAVLPMATAPALSSPTLPQDHPAFPPQPFSEWINNFHPPALAAKPEKAPATSPKTALAEKTTVAQALAERSVAENKDVVSETLARLLVKQGYREKAMAMYERLALLFPEKSAFFVAEIDKLKK